MHSLLSLRIGKTLDYNRDTYQQDGGNNPEQISTGTQPKKAPRVHIPYATPTSPKSQPLPSLLSLRTGPRNSPDKPLDYYRPDALDAASFVNSIITQESGGNYNAIGLKTKSGDRAYGKYQVMGANIPSWTKETLGVSMTPQQYLKDQKAQDNLATKRLTDLFKKHGAADAAAIWFSGGTLAKNGWKKDANGKSVADYVKEVVSRLGQTAGAASFVSAVNADTKPLPSLLEVRLKNPQKWTPTVEEVQSGFKYNSPLDNQEAASALFQAMKQNVADKFPKLTEENALEEGTKMGMNFGGGALGTTKKVVGKAAKPIFEGFTDLSTKLLEKLKGKSGVSKQFISDLTNSPDLKQPERDLFRRILDDSGDNSPLAQEAQKYPEILNFKNPEGITPIKQDGKIVGGIDASVNRSDPQRLDIHYVRIIPEAQGKGLGTQAISQLFKDNPDVNKLVGHATAESKSFWQKQPGVEFSGSEKNIFTITRPKVDPLIAEAQKYKSAEEFVKAQEGKSNLLGYHGTSETGAASIERGGFFHMKDGTVYFATNPSEVKTYGSNVIKRDLSGLKLLDDHTPQAAAIRKQAGVAEDSYGFANEKVREIAKQQGYDGLKTRTSKNNYDVMVFDNTKMNDIYNQTKSQLTDIWNKAYGK